MSHPVDLETSASMDGKGSFVVGTMAQFFFTFSDSNGEVFDPSDIDISILDPSGVEYETFSSADKIEEGIFAITWTIPTDAVVGKYTIVVEYTVETSSGAEAKSFTEYFVILEESLGVTSLRSISVRAFLETFLRYSQRIPVFNEPGRLNRLRTVAEFSFQRWNQTATVKVWVNNTLRESGYTVNYLKGKITFENPLSQYDQVMASYTFRWFTDSELDSFVEQGINTFNIFPPQSVYHINNIPDRYLIIGVHGAAVFALRTLMMDLQFQEPAKIFGGLERAQQVFQNMDTLKKNYEEMLKLFLEQKKFGPYIGLTMTVTTPEFTLPGGRCLAHDSLIVYTIGGEEFTSTVQDLYEISKTKQICVLSDQNGELVFAEVSKIWESGTKSVLKIEDDQGNKIEVSEDHIMFIGDEEVPASEVLEGDVLTIISNQKIKHSVVKSVGFSREVLTFDIEVPSTENLFVNNIKCHNSRWFRYLFKG